MARLTSEQKIEYRTWLEQWHNPAEMLDYSESIQINMSQDSNGVSKDLFNQAGTNFVLEAHAAARFASIRKASEVRLVSQNKPDFQTKIGGEIESWELTEADIRDRKRGDEYRLASELAANGEPLLEDDPVEDWYERADQIPDILKERSHSKAQKQYPPNTRLLIYLNVNTSGVRREKIEGMMGDSVSPAKNSFNEVWVLWGKQAYKLWVDGKETFVRINTP